MPDRTSDISTSSASRGKIDTTCIGSLLWSSRKLGIYHLLFVAGYERSAARDRIVVLSKLREIRRRVGLSRRIGEKIGHRKPPMKLFTMHGEPSRAVESQLNAIPADFDHFDGDVVSDHDTLAQLAA
jgi:hypothetical protein